MKWKKISDPNDNPLFLYGDNDRILLTDGDEVYLSYVDHERFYLLHNLLNPTIDKDELIKTMTYWAKIDLPERIKICHKWPCKCNNHPHGRMGYSGFGDPMPSIELEISPKNQKTKE